MPYTNTWNAASPTGAEASNTIDNIIRTTKLDIFERLDSFFEDVDTDPLQIKSGASTFGSFTVATDLALTNGTTTINNADIADAALALALTHVTYAGTAITSTITRAGSSSFKHLNCISGGTSMFSVDGTGKGVIKQLQSGETDHASIANGVGVSPFATDVVPAAGIWLVLARSYAPGNEANGAGLYICGGSVATSYTRDLGSSTGCSWIISPVDSKTPYFLNSTGGAVSIVTAYIRIQ